MLNMISGKKDTGHILTDEQQVQVVICSLCFNWEHMKIHLTHNENIKTFEDAMRHLELKEDRFSSHGILSSKHKHGGFYKWKEKGEEKSSQKFDSYQQGKGKSYFKKKEKRFQVL
ncbi:hypothetical protein CDL12_07386 [Handroanthus impetiginosus]|uniref:Uncharacterized protein n=1 Tax=Handroanthus impetiginosus TaxID=429701 RepID=A0A2G9HQX4_9LAMI|nr:hypothetical protein CDL12_07386 [Handroanthus impetiginosus]